MVFSHIIKAGAPTPHPHSSSWDEGRRKSECEQFPFKKVLQKLYMAVKFIFPLVEHGHMATVGCRRRKPEKLGGTLKIRGVLYLKVLGEYE